MATAVRRVVPTRLVVRPVLEHASTVWCTTFAQQAALSRSRPGCCAELCACPVRWLTMCCGWSLGADPVPAGWTSKLESAFRLKAMACVGCAKGRQEPRPTVSHHLRILGDPAKHTNKPGRASVESQRFKFICRAGVMPTARRQWQQGRACCAPTARRRPFSTLCSPARLSLLSVLRCGLRSSRRWELTEAAAAVRALPVDSQLAALLGDARLGDHAPAVDGMVRAFLACSSGGRGSSWCLGAAGGTVCDPADVACQTCHARSGAATMLPGVSHALPRAGADGGACR
jgi:hypothetical protein